MALTAKTLSLEGLAPLGRRGMLPMTHGLIHGVFCYETAAFLNGMSQFGDDVLFMYCPGIKETINTGIIVYYPTETGELNEDECVVRAEGVLVTNPIRTIRELIKRNAYAEQVCECLDWWNREYGSLGGILIDLELNGIQGKLQPYLDAMSEYGYEYRLWDTIY